MSHLHRPSLITDFQTSIHLARRSFLTTAFSWGVYLAESIIVLVACLVLVNYRNTVLKDYVLVLGNPFLSALTVASVFAAIYLALASCTALTREKEEGTLYVLFTGPVNTTSFVMGSFVAQVLTGALILTVLGVSFWLISLMTGFYLPLDFIISLVYALIVISGMSAFGILVGAVIGKTRAAITVLLLSVLAALILQTGDSLLYRQSFQEAGSRLFVVGRTFHTLNSVVKWISPFSYLVNGIEAFALHSWMDIARNLLSSMVFTAVLLSLAMRTLNVKGVLPS
jgi:ABC-type transport system involved in multi-copper enzyme maturation permease subunit